MMGNTAGVPDGFVDLSVAVSGLVIEARYAGDDNFIGRPVDGYGANKAYLSQEAAAALAGAQADLAAAGLRLKIFDAYRPQRAVDHFVRWMADEDDIMNKAAYYPELEKNQLVPQGYIATKSGHSRGSTLDLTLMDATGRDLDMGSPFDFLGAISHPDAPEISAEARANRYRLRDAMLKHGFKASLTEWWHFTLVQEPYPDTYFDFPVE